MRENDITFKFAEVVNSYKDTYKYLEGEESGNLFHIDVITYGELEARTLSARPANPHIKQIPLVGEHVLIFNALQQESNNDNKIDQWYYLPAYSIQSAINNNALPGVASIQGEIDTNDLSNQPLGDSFEEKTVSPIQPYEGDVIIEGRFSNSIRLGSTVTNTSSYTLTPTWSGDINGDPIIILSNAHNDLKDKQFTIESFEDDMSSLYLTSLQQLDNLTLSKTLEKSKGISEYSNSQLIGNANRIVLRAKSDSIILDSPNRITLNTPDLRIGGEGANHPLVKGDELKRILAELINAIIAGVVYTPAGIISSPVQVATLHKLRGELYKINSNKHYLDN